MNTVYLIGGFLINDNYGDVIQAEQWISHYKSNKIRINFICHKNGALKCRKILKLNQDELITLEQIVNLKFIKGEKVFLHMYGGGYLNEMWSDHFIPVIEKFQNQKKQIIATGVQVDKHFFEKSKKYNIHYLSVRDEISAKYTNCRLIADDSFAYFYKRKSFYDLSSKLSSYKLNRRVLLQLNLNKYVFDEHNIEKYKNILSQYIQNLKISNQIIFASSFPKDINDIQENQNLVNSLGLNLQDYNYVTSMNLDHKVYDYYDLIIVNSFHTYLMLINKYRCPVYYLAFSKYYQQKALGLQNYGLLEKDKLITSFEDLEKINKTQTKKDNYINRKHLEESLFVYIKVIKAVEKEVFNYK